MRKNNQDIEQYRIRGNHMLASSESDGNNGVFIIPGPRGVHLAIIASDELGWEHVSVSRIGKSCVPYWDEMCFVKRLFWEPEEAVMQLHPPESQYINIHPGVLHLWRPSEGEIPLPNSSLV